MVDGVKGTGQVSKGKAEVEDSPKLERRASQGSSAAAAADAAPISTRETRKAPPPSLAAQLLSAIEDLSAIDAEKKQFKAQNPNPLHPEAEGRMERRDTKKAQIEGLQKEVKTHMTAEREVFLAFKAALKADPKADLSTLEDQFQSDAEQQIFATFLNAMDQPDARAFFADKTEIRVTPEESAAHDAERERLEDLEQEVHATQFDEDKTVHFRLLREFTEGAKRFELEHDRLSAVYQNESDELRDFQTEILGQDGASLDRRKAMATHFFSYRGGDYNIADFRPPEEGKAEVEGSPKQDRPASQDSAAAAAAAGKAEVNETGAINLDDQLAIVTKKLAALKEQMHLARVEQYSLLCKKYLTPEAIALLKIKQTYRGSTDTTDLSKYYRKKFEGEELVFFDKFVAAINAGDDKNGARKYYCNLSFQLSSDKILSYLSDFSEMELYCDSHSGGPKDTATANVKKMHEDTVVNLDILADEAKKFEQEFFAE